MFAKAYEIASQFTQPLVVNIRYFDNTLESGLGSFIILNVDGWCMTAAHNFNTAFAFQDHQNELKEYNEKVEKINANKQIKQSQLNAAKRMLKPNPKWVTNFNILLGSLNADILEYHIHGPHDIAFFRVDPARLAAGQIFPKIKNHNNITPGTSLCKLGFPFVEFKAAFDQQLNHFTLPDNLFPIARFPMEGMYTREMITGKDDQQQDVKFLETSSPGLRGQSGGPIFDMEGVVYAVQSQNLTLPLGFVGEVELNGKKVKENQFLNVGIGVHPETLHRLLTEHNITHEIID